MATLRRARTEHPIAAVRSEYSLRTRNPEIAVIEAYHADEYRFDTPEGPRILPKMTPTEGYPQFDPAKDDDVVEYLVPVRWIHTVSRNEAFSEVGLFGNQNTFCKPTTPKWSHTVSRLRQLWRIDDERQ